MFASIVRVVVALAVLSAPMQTAYARSCCDESGAGSTKSAATVDPSMAAHAQRRSNHAQHQLKSNTHCADGGCQCAKACKTSCFGMHGGLIDLSSVAPAPVLPVYVIAASINPADVVLPTDTPPPK